MLAQLAIMTASGIDLTPDTPDGRFSVVPNGSSFIKFQVPNLRYVGTTDLPVEGTVAPTYMVKDSNMIAGTMFSNPLPGNEVTGLRVEDTWDMFNKWTMSIFRLSETSMPDSSPSNLIGFSHCEDHEQDSVWKSVHVVTSTDLALRGLGPCQF